ncbi:hypothetical protein PENVUL_c023G08309 [Penicillium vulpinum]|uniref:Protein kinase domain-containing protein n=1 Tax=Penicillium vulpinum TaxID=29845 RepID=A0A1V6RUU9_9EURO|nr:hypothetical protein PENVUL_c023G08309 [Penicillium vulpinum]
MGLITVWYMSFWGLMFRTQLKHIFPMGGSLGSSPKSLRSKVFSVLIACNNGILHMEVHNLTEDKFTKMLGNPDIGYVRSRDGKDLESSLPERSKSSTLGDRFYILRYLKHYTPLPVRAPEVIFQDRIDYRVDLWSMGCMLFELFAGQPPFDTFLITPPILVGQMREMVSDELPERWHKIWDMMNADDGETPEGTAPNLQEWLEEVYFESPQSPDLTRDDIARLGQIIGRVLLFEPSARASARQILEDPWFDE